ncbi:MAG: hypothetical protein CSA62_12955 [Planctomycetota bacterium]|nr:MAG: hypothetical protein CSA62_12955 [Planctomycetota bacterium]
MNSRTQVIVLDVWDPARGGLEFYAESLLDALRLQGAPCRVVCGERRAELDVDCEELGGRGPEFYRRLDRRGQRDGEQLLHFRHPGALPGVFLPLGGLLAAALDARRKAEPAYLRPFKRLARSLDARTRCYLGREQSFFTQAQPGLVLASSTLTAAEVNRRYPDFEGRVEVTGLPVDADHFSLPSESDRLQAREALQLGPDSLVLLWLGHDPVRKGLAVARRVLRRLRLRRLDARLVCAGHGTRRIHGKEPGLVGLGQRSDVLRLLHAGDLLFLPSLEDNLSFVVLEALATGLPCVTSAQNGAASFLSEPELGRVLQDPKDVAEADRLVLVSLTKGMLAADLRQRRRQAVAPCFAPAHFARVLELLEPRPR